MSLLMNIAVVPATALSIATNINGFRPPQWSSSPGAGSPQLVYVKTNINGYFFDAVLRMNHTSPLRKTEHPIQTGANLVDHAYMLPAHLTLEIGMSDSMDSLVLGQYSGGATKSISAYQTLVKLQQSRVPLTVVTRLQKYVNMLITNINAPDDVNTSNALKCSITLEQIFMAQVGTTTPSSSRGQTTSAPTDTGTEQPAAAGDPETTVGTPSEGNSQPVDLGHILPSGTGVPTESGTPGTLPNEGEQVQGEPLPESTNQGIGMEAVPPAPSTVNQDAVQQSMTGQSQTTAPNTTNPNGMALDNPALPKVNLPTFGTQ